MHAREGCEAQEIGKRQKQTKLENIVVSKRSKETP
jgi:hypothetical protein